MALSNSLSQNILSVVIDSSFFCSLATWITLKKRHQSLYSRHDRLVYDSPINACVTNVNLSYWRVANLKKIFWDWNKHSNAGWHRLCLICSIKTFFFFFFFFFTICKLQYLNLRTRAVSIDTKIQSGKNVTDEEGLKFFLWDITNMVFVFFLLIAKIQSLKEFTN